MTVMLCLIGTNCCFCSVRKGWNLPVFLFCKELLVARNSGVDWLLQSLSLFFRTSYDSEITSNWVELGLPINVDLNIFDLFMCGVELVLDHLHLAIDTLTRCCNCNLAIFFLILAQLVQDRPNVLPAVVQLLIVTLYLLHQPNTCVQFERDLVEDRLGHILDTNDFLRFQGARQLRRVGLPKEFLVLLEVLRRLRSCVPPQQELRCLKLISLVLRE